MTYPPARHFLRDLGLRLPVRPHVDEDGGVEVATELEVGPDLLDPTGELGAGFLATCADIIAGHVARGAVAPDWVATSDLSLQILARVGTGRLSLRSRLLREGRGMVLCGVEARRDADSVGRDSVGRDPVAIAWVTYSRLPRNDEKQPSVAASEQPEEETDEGPGSSRSLVDRIGLRPSSSGDGVELELHDYIRNSLGGLQGGLSGLLLERAAERAVAGSLDRSARALDLQVRFVNVGRRGPFVATGRLLRRLGGTLLVQAEVKDRGLEDRPVALGRVTLSTELPS